MKARSVVGIVLLGAVILGGAGVFYKAISTNAHLWVSDYFFSSPSFTESDQTVDIIFVVVDHWEPGGKAEIVNSWMNDYRRMAERHLDADGIPLQHTWYYPIESFRGWEVDSLVKLCSLGLGDVEVHLHHFDDSSASLRQILSSGIDSLQAHGALVGRDGRDRFSFIHGNWALDNSRGSIDGRTPCGVNDEISILIESGCYSDCTFPSLNQTSQPSLVNKIFYAVDDPEKPKSYDEGELSHVGYEGHEDELMMFEGPLMIDWSDWRFGTHPTIDDGNLYHEIPTSLHRFEVWVSANVHVRGRPNWVFVRPFTHGAYLSHGGAANIMGENFEQMLRGMETKYNDGKRYRLHYMTTREAYNVIKAAEAGLDGNPNDYRDFVIPPYDYTRADVS